MAILTLFSTHSRGIRWLAPQSVISNCRITWENIEKINLIASIFPASRGKLRRVQHHCASHMRFFHVRRPAPQNETKTCPHSEQSQHNMPAPLAERSHPSIHDEPPRRHEYFSANRHQYRRSFIAALRNLREDTSLSHTM